MNNLRVSASPHLVSPRSTAGIMMSVVAALIPAGVVAVLVFGVSALLVILTCVATAVISEYLFCKLTKRNNTIGDFSAVVTGLLLAYNLPSSIPLWMAVVGTVFSIVFVKMFFGGIGDNFANPAIAGRIFMLLSFTSEMTTFPAANSYISGIDSVSGATPLAVLKFQGVQASPSINNMLLGIRGGSLGEVATIALLIGGIYLIIKRIITPTIPLCMLATIYLMSMVVGADPLYMLMSGGTMIAAFFMATDYVSSPSHETAKAVFAIGIGIVTVLIRQYANAPEGMSYAVLIFNILTPHLENLPRKMPFGGSKA